MIDRLECTLREPLIVDGYIEEAKTLATAWPAVFRQESNMRAALAAGGTVYFDTVEPADLGIKRSYRLDRPWFALFRLARSESSEYVIFLTLYTDSRPEILRTPSFPREVPPPLSAPHTEVIKAVARNNADKTLRAMGLGIIHRPPEPTSADS